MLRKKLRLTQREMASELGVTKGALSMWESGSRAIPGTVLKLIEIYEESLDEELALRKHDETVRKLTVGWARQLMLSFARGSKKVTRKHIEAGLAKSLYTFFRYELNPNWVKRKLQISLFNRIVKVAAKSKGLPMKFVQAITFLNPTMHHEAREALERIHSLQYPMAPTAVAKIVAADLGSYPSTLFSEWSPKPFATASIGQVHLARLKTGEKVAVKIQYPDIQQSLHRDLALIGLSSELISTFVPEARTVIEKLQEALLNEVDYDRERELLEKFGRIFASSKNIIIPKVYGRYCSPRILTMEYIEGKTIAEFRKSPAKERKKAAETLAEFITATAFKAGIMNTDTHAGNFIFCPGGRVGFIDFGRTVQLEPKVYGELLKAVIRKDANTARNLLPVMFPIKKKTANTPFPFDEVWSCFLAQQSHLHSGEFRFTREHIEKTVFETKRFLHQYQVELVIESVWSIATSMGLWSILADLDVPVNYGKISLEVLDSRP